MCCRYLLVTHAPSEPRHSALTVCPRLPKPYDAHAPGCDTPSDRRTIYYRNASDILFDDMRLHMAFNNGPEERVALFVDVRRPYAYARGLRGRAAEVLANSASRLFLGVVGRHPKVRTTVDRVNAFHARAAGFDDEVAPLADYFHDGESFAHGEDDYSPW